MKTQGRIGILLMILAVVLAVVMVSRAQDKPAAYTLSPETTKELVILAQQKATLIKAFSEVEEKERLLMVGSGVPEAARKNCTRASDTAPVICSVPPKPETPKEKP